LCDLNSFLILCLKADEINYFNRILTKLIIYYFKRILTKLIILNKS
jgi:hypothetical protein